MKTIPTITFLVIAALTVGSAHGASILLGGFDGTQTQNTISPATTSSSTGVRELRQGFKQDAGAVGNVSTRIWTDQNTGKEFQWSARTNSTNTLWGVSTFTVAPASGTANPYVGNFRLGGTITSWINYEISNTGTQNLILDKLHFNLARGSATDGGNTITVSLQQNGTFAASPVLSASDLTAVGPVNVTLTQTTSWVGYEVNLANVSSTTLAAGDTATFRIAVPAWGSDSFLDNIAISGTIVPVPEPSAALLGGIGALLLLRRRR
ncbi:hypothetical protein HZ994_08355 [Akkermansiaceae bacterium]|nr:hypothetical protein HZ994_08355 [Akkermansiaceae bacterium]